MSCVNSMSYINNMIYVNNMSYACRLYHLYELCKSCEYFYESLKNNLLFVFKKFGIFLLVCKRELNLHYKNENIERKYF